MEIIRNQDLVYQKPSRPNYPYSLSAKIIDSNQLFIYSELLKPGMRSSAPHYHREIDEVIFILKGKLEVVEGQSCSTLTMGDTVCFKANSKVLHYLENKTDKDAEFLIIRKSMENSDASFE